MPILKGVATQRKEIEVEVSDDLAREISAWCRWYGVSLDYFLTMMSENGKIEVTAESISQAIHTH